MMLEELEGAQRSLRELEEAGESWRKLEKAGESWWKLEGVRGGSRELNRGAQYIRHFYG